MHALLQCAALYSAPTASSNVDTWSQNSNRSVIWCFNKMICDTRELKVLILLSMCNFLMIWIFLLAQPTNTVINIQHVWADSVLCSIIVHVCSIWCSILLNRVCMGSPRPCARAKAPSKTLIVLGQSCKRIRGSQSGLEKSSSQVAHCDRCPLEDFSISFSPPSYTLHLRHPSLPPNSLSASKLGESGERWSRPA